MSGTCSFIRLTLGGVSWRIREGAKDDLIPALRDGITALTANAEVLKDKPLRSVLRLALPGGRRTVVIKQYKTRGPWEVFKQSFLSSAAVSEWRAACAMSNRGVPVPLPLAVGHARRGAFVACSWFISEAAPKARNLREAIEGRHCSPAMVEEAARAVRTMHDAGFQHPDLHASNLLVSEYGAAPRVYLADLHEVRRCRMGFRARCLDLARLNASLPAATASQTDRMRFMRDYLNARECCGLKTWSLEVLAFTRKLLARHYRRRTRNCLVNSSLFAVERTDVGKLYRICSSNAKEIMDLLDSHAKCLAGGEGTVLKRTAHTNVTLVARPGGSHLCVKEYRARGILNRLKDIFRRPPAVREWIAARALSVRNIPAPQAIAAVRAPMTSPSRSHYFITRGLTDAMPLSEYVARLSPSRTERTKFVHGAADFLASLHQRQVVHGDLKASNLLVDRSGSFILVDLGAMSFRTARTRDIVKNLAQLHSSIPLCVTSTDRLRFLRRYLRRMGLVRLETHIARSVLRESMKRNELWQRM